MCRHFHDEINENHEVKIEKWFWSRQKKRVEQKIRDFRRNFVSLNSKWSAKLELLVVVFVHRKWIVHFQCQFLAIFTNWLLLSFFRIFVFFLFFDSNCGVFWLQLAVLAILFVFHFDLHQYHNLGIVGGKFV